MRCVQRFNVIEELSQVLISLIIIAVSNLGFSPKNRVHSSIPFPRNATSDIFRVFGSAFFRYEDVCPEFPAISCGLFSATDWIFLVSTQAFHMCGIEKSAKLGVRK